MHPPDKVNILRFISESPTPLTKRDIVEAFGVKGDDRIEIKRILKELESEGALVKLPGQTYAVPSGLPAVSIIEVTHIDIDGDVFARPVDWNESLLGAPPRIEVTPGDKGHPALREHDRVLAKLHRLSDKKYEARVIRRLDDPRGRVLGVIQKTKRGFILAPTDKKARFDFDVAQEDLNGAREDDIAMGEIQPARGSHNKKVRITKVIGRRDDPKAISLIALSEAGMHEDFLPRVIEETKGMKVPDIKGREDLRHIPLVTIDGADARDFDDAVFAEKTDAGFHLIVAIADVSYYVRPGSELDKEAYRRGNSTYFPDRVVPMLPEALSNDLCSLRPNEDRACMAFHLYIDPTGHLEKYHIVRGLMKSVARLTYEQVQAAKDGVVDDVTRPLMEPVILPLYAGYDILNAARLKRGALELDLPERQIIIDAHGTMTGVKNRLRFDSHKLIEEFMILANVAAAQALEARRAPCVYRVHDRPSMQKLDSAREFVTAFGLSLPKGNVTQPRQINHLLELAKKLPYSHLISEVILRTQAQAVYAPDNIGHFGLALSKYAHFTSPIRRYADLLVHRSLIAAYGLGPGGLTDEEKVKLEEKSAHISETERTSASAERSAVDRFTATWLSQRIGAEFSARISGVTRFGLFISLDENGADGLIPIRSLPQDFYVHDEKQHALVGRKSGRLYRLGAQVQVYLREADGMTGSSVFALANDASADIPGVSFKKTNLNRPDPRKNGKQGKNRFKSKGKKGRRR
ncbi:MAG: ribonuclease R [Alphaproteobacteria bacterium]|nr:ribonuclease R [Alphaproteobacteria bacterium]